MNRSPQRIKLNWHRDLPEFEPSLTISSPGSSLRSLKAACLANMGLERRAAEAAHMFHPPETEVTLEAVQRAPSRSDVVRWLAARDGEGEDRADGA